jgi:glyoxylase-like metal-dependent hydrolase (beta-lactamase superfamily II)
MQAKPVRRVLGPIALLGAAAAVQAQPGFGPPELTLVPVEGHDNIYLIRNQFAGNITVLVGEEGVILVDSKMQQDHDGVIAFVEEVTDAPVTYVINTHMHPDHAGGNPALQAIGAAVVSSENARRVMTEQGTAGRANLTLSDSMRIWLDDMPVDLHYLGRGHTNGDIIVHLPTEDAVIMGDLFALWGPYEAVIDYASGASLRDWPVTLDRALGFDFETVIPGHSGVTTRANIEGFRDHLLSMQAMVRDMIAQGRPREDILQMMQTEFNWGGLSSRFLDGLIVEMGGSVAPAGAGRGGLGGGGRRGAPPQ